MTVTADRMGAFARVRAEDDPNAPMAPARALDGFFVSDQPSLSLTASMFAWDSPAQADRLYSTDRLVEWLALVGFPALSSAPTNGQLEQLRELREAVYRLAQARLADVAPDPRAVELVNSGAALATPIPQLSATGFARDADERFEFAGLLSLLARNAIEVLAGPWSHRLRRCERNPCTHMFVDRSPSGARRWCTSASCGNRVRAAEFRHRHVAN